MRANKQPTILWKMNRLLGINLLGSRQPRAVLALALRREEEEAIAGDQKEGDSSRRQDDEMQGDRDKVCAMSCVSLSGRSSYVV